MLSNDEIFPKIEVYRKSLNKSLLYENDDISNLITSLTHDLSNHNIIFKLKLY